MNYVSFLIWCKQGKQAAIDPKENSQHQMQLHQAKTEKQKEIFCEHSSALQ
jgi:ribonuclease BN (tRNA processing enzyme)